MSGPRLAIARRPCRLRCGALASPRRRRLCRIADAGAASVDAGAALESVDGCVETIPAGGAAPDARRHLPRARATSGYAATLQVDGRARQGRDRAARRPRAPERERRGASALKERGLRHSRSGRRRRGAPHETPTSTRRAAARQTTLELPLVAAADGARAHTLILPPLPVAVARANGDVVTLCTKPHTIVVEDPTASTPDAQAEAEPAAARAARRVDRARATALIWMARRRSSPARSLAWLVYRWLHAAEARAAAAAAAPAVGGRARAARRDAPRGPARDASASREYFDRVNDAVREYLGARFGFDGLESTTDEIARGARRAAPLRASRCPRSSAFLQECDLVKFANVDPDARGVRASARRRPSASCARRCRAMQSSRRRRRRAPASHARRHAMSALVRGRARRAVGRSRCSSLALRLAGARARRGVAEREVDRVARAARRAPVDGRHAGWLARAALVRASCGARRRPLRRLADDARRRRARPAPRAPDASRRSSLGPRGWRTPAPRRPRASCAARRSCSAILALGAPAERPARRERRRAGHRHRPRPRPLRLDGAPSWTRRRRSGPGHRARRAAHRPTRIDVAKDVLVDFVRRRKTDRIGVVVFAQAGVRALAADARLRPPHAARLEDRARRHRRQQDRHRRRGRHRRGAHAPEQRAVARRSSCSPTATRTRASISPEYSAHLAQKRGRARLHRADRQRRRRRRAGRASTSSASRVYARERFPVNPELLQHDGARDRRRGVHRDRQAGPREQHARDPRPPREDAASSRRRRRWRTSSRSCSSPRVVLVALEALVRLAARAEVPVRWGARLRRRSSASLVAAFCALAFLGFAAPLVVGERPAGARGASASATRRSSRTLVTYDATARRAVKGVLLVARDAPARSSRSRGPQFGSGTRLIPATNLDVVIVLDYSKSMYARDVAPSRIARAKAEVARLIQRSAGRALRRRRVRRRADELPADERRRGDRAVLPPARPERHARRRHRDGAGARARRASSSRATPSRRTTCASSSS